MSDKARAARCRREAAGHLRCAEQPHLSKGIADALRKEAERLLAKAAELAGPPPDAPAAEPSIHKMSGNPRAHAELEAVSGGKTVSYHDGLNSPRMTTAT
jgi:hypothetical protein